LKKNSKDIKLREPLKTRITGSYKIS